MSFRFRPIALLVLVPGLGLAARPASADDTVGATGGWTVTLRANAIAGPKYPGASDMGFVAYPSGSIRRAGTKSGYSSPDDGLGLALYDSAVFKIGPVLRYQPGRYDGQDARLRGIHDARWAIEPGVFAEIWPMPDVLRGRFELRRGFGGHQGFVGTFGFDLVQRYGAWTFSAGPRVHVADAEYMRSYFGVTPRDAAWNPRVAPYRPDAGLKSLGSTVAVSYNFSESWSATAHASYERLARRAAASPIVSAFGSRDQLSFGVTLAYSFGWKGF